MNVEVYEKKIEQLENDLSNTKINRKKILVLSNLYKNKIMCSKL